MNKFEISIGDWSGDGHDKFSVVLYSANRSVEEMQQAYKDSCKLTGIQFNYRANDQNYTDREDTNKWWQVCCEYEDNKIDNKAIEVLIKYDCPLEEFMGLDHILDPESMADLIMWFIGLSISENETEFKWERVKENIPSLNGGWNKNLNVQFGYGLYG